LPEIDPGAGPWAEVEADAGGPGVDALAVRDLVGSGELDVAVDRVARAETVLGREVDALARADRDLRLGVELEPVLEEPLRRSELEQGRARRTAVGEPVVGEDQPETAGEGAVAIFDQAAPGDPPRRASQIILVPGARADRPGVPDPRAGVDSELAGAVLPGIGLADSEAGLALARVSEKVDLRAMMLGLDLPCGRRAAGRRRDASLGLIVADSDLRPDLGLGGGAVANIDPGQVGRSLVVRIVDRRGADLDLLVLGPNRDPAAGIGGPAGHRVQLVIDHNELRIER
jgi:hypothetical protein